ncbi:hypothetical protein [Thalassotalea atypica]|uniref:hypothetical protein n=1 Tax=Thalassotalea atypica TaxID=2054316 RepID=UPI002572D963|nr:hypothetical protein [Thalassotalea atypica]
MMKKFSPASILLILTFTMSAQFDAMAKSKKCDKYKKKYEDIQAKQRQPNNNKRSNQLKDKARKSFHQWQQCKQGKIK